MGFGYMKVVVCSGDVLSSIKLKHAMVVIASKMGFDS
jgi:hypothetical protein